jgi:hypothetical protein
VQPEGSGWHDGAVVDEGAGRLTRREVLWASAVSAVVLLSGCGRGSSSSATTPPVTFDPEDAPTVPDLGEMTPEHVEDARTFLVAVPPALRARARGLLPPEVHEGVDSGLLGLSDVCPSDQIQLRFCETSRWFNCPACGSMFDILGGYRAGPASRGMTMFGLSIGDPPDRNVSIRRHPELAGLARDAHLAAQEPSGPFCL